MNTTRSAQFFAQARELIPGGVNSPVRACRAVGCDPLFVQQAQGCRITDVDGNTFIDLVSSWGPMILGHAHPEVVEAIRQTAALGTSFGAPSPLEVELAELVCAAVPSLDKVRFVNSGTEATMSAIRLARAHTGRDVVVKFDGCYHGHADSFLVKAGSGLITLGIPGSPGVPEDIVKNTISIAYNDTALFKQTLQERASDIACVIVEPVAGNMGVVLPEPGFLETLRSETRAHGIVLIFDEVITGFRLAFGGAAQYFGVTPDLVTYGKIIGAGMPVGAYGGRRDVMELVAPAGKVYQAGTLSGNPVAMAAGLTQLKYLYDHQEIYTELEKKGELLYGGMGKIVKEKGLNYQMNHVGSLGSLFFTGQPVVDYVSAKSSDTVAFAEYFKKMLNMGIHMAPSQFEAMFLSAAHTDEIIMETLDAVKLVL